MNKRIKELDEQIAALREEREREVIEAHKTEVAALPDPGSEEFWVRETPHEFALRCTGDISLRHNGEYVELETPERYVEISKAGFLAFAKYLEGA